MLPDNFEWRPSGAIRNPDYDNPRTRPCPTYKAAIGNPCTRPAPGGRISRSDYHPARKNPTTEDSTE